MTRNVISRREATSSKRLFPSPLNAGVQTAAPAAWPQLPGGAAGMKPLSGEIPCGVFAAYAAAIASTGFLLVMACTGGIHFN